MGSQKHIWYRSYIKMGNREKHVVNIREGDRYCKLYVEEKLTIVLSSGPEDLGSIPGRVLPKTLKIVLDTSFLNTQQYKVGSNPGKGVAPSPTPRCSSY